MHKRIGRDIFLAFCHFCTKTNEKMSQQEGFVALCFGMIV